RVLPVPRPARARAAGGRAALGGPRLPVPRRVLLRLRGDDPGHRRRLAEGGARARPPAGASRGRLHGRELRRAAARRTRGRAARELARAAPDALDRLRGRDRRRAVPPALADHADARAARPGDLVPRVLRNRPVRALLVAEIVSMTGSQMTWLALPWF